MNNARSMYHRSSTLSDGMMSLRRSNSFQTLRMPIRQAPSNSYQSYQSRYRSNGDSMVSMPMNPMAYLDHLSEVLPFLYLSGQNPVTAAKLKVKGITHIINCAAESTSLPNIPGITVTYLHIYDTPTERISQYFDSVADKIETVRLNGGRVLIHCIAGVSRSVTLLLAYMLKYRQMNLKEAFHHVRSKRPIIQPNNGFWMQIIAYERQLFGRTTVFMTQAKYSGGGWGPSVYSDSLSVSNSSSSYSPAASSSHTPSNYSLTSHLRTLSLMQNRY